MIDLYYWPTPNGHKVTIFLEETGLEYKIVPVNIRKGDQFAPKFLRTPKQPDACRLLNVIENQLAESPYLAGRLLDRRHGDLSVVGRNAPRTRTAREPPEFQAMARRNRRPSRSKTRRRRKADLPPEAAGRRNPLNPLRHQTIRAPLSRLYLSPPGEDAPPARVRAHALRSMLAPSPARDTGVATRDLSRGER